MTYVLLPTMADTDPRISSSAPLCLHILQDHFQPLYFKALSRDNPSGIDLLDTFRYNALPPA